MLGLSGRLIDFAIGLCATVLGEAAGSKCVFHFVFVCLFDTVRMCRTAFLSRGWTSYTEQKYLKYRLMLPTVRLQGILQQPCAKCEFP